jgi:membrane-associated phospholipid phosphatase
MKPGLGRKLGLLVVFAIVCTQSIRAQEDEKTLPVANSPSQDQSPSSTPSDTNPDREKASGGLKQILVDFGQDQKQIWTSPARIRFSDAAWLVPFGGITASLFVTDRQYSASLSNSPSTIRRYNNISNAGIAGLAGAAAGMYLISFPAHNEHWRETGWLAGEAALNSLIPIELMKYSLGRERPYQGTGSGQFLQGGTSFPSEHAAAAWSIAGVIAHEYPGVLPQLLSYGTAAAIDVSRIHGRQHFPSDVFIGSVLGYLVAQNVYGRRHEPQLGGGAWEPPSHFMEGDRSRSPAYMGSAYVPLDSWIYPAIERLAAFGFVRTASLGLRPWTRLECARLVSEADDLQAGDSGSPEVQQLYTTLSDEFAPEFGLMTGDRNMSARLESVYARSVGISGMPLTDNFHFGQTFLNDYGRPFQEGFNSIAGLSESKRSSRGRDVSYKTGTRRTKNCAARAGAFR